MRGSTLHQAIVEEGREDGFVEGRAEGRDRGRIVARSGLLLQLGSKRWGEPNVDEKTTLQSIADPERLYRMFDGLLERPGDFANWSDLLQIP